ncbi:MAG: hypothetical protein KKA65_03780 [Nanoarchaeota archaeon]|nr:hypothetical protein [Nanoarchaeota archaeon]MBU4241814.1 hypothetical protein [Nanoarchaeota archaeon]MBU4352225.1 hypothetical protein [Nanoarchaeota archaeon]MBU4456597.1 hypothetical protein [Nanoarchaeota archaeon]MCG2719826.1 hypothetical protein [Nanoarchaeota archaeon]
MIGKALGLIALIGTLGCGCAETKPAETKPIEIEIEDSLNNYSQEKDMVTYWFFKKDSSKIKDMGCAEIKGKENKDLFKFKDKVKLKLGEVTSTQYLEATLVDGTVEKYSKDCRLLLDYEILKE